MTAPKPRPDGAMNQCPRCHEKYCPIIVLNGRATCRCSRGHEWSVQREDWMIPA
jgi:hypothetical protein